MAKMLLTIQHNGRVFSPPVMEGVKIDWERTGAAGKLTFTTIKSTAENMSFQEGDPVCFYYDDKPVFMGYVFTKKRDKEHHVEVTCYDQIRYLKNKYTYLFENKKASQIIQALCSDFNLKTGEIDDTGYVIPYIGEENKSALDIALDVLEETLHRLGDMYVLYDDFGKLNLKNVANMVSSTLICEDTAENFSYASSIDSETYNSIVLYYKNNDELIRIFSAYSPSTISQWGTLRYFEEVKNPTVGMEKAKSLLSLYNKKSRELTISGAFGDTSVRGGTLIPVKLNLGDLVTNNYMLVEKVTHNFDNDHHTMDLTLTAHWEDAASDVVYTTTGKLPDKTQSPSETIDKPKLVEVGDHQTGATVEDTYVESPTNYTGSFGVKHVTIHCNGIDAYAGVYSVTYWRNGTSKTESLLKGSKTFAVDEGSKLNMYIVGAKDHNFVLTVLRGSVTQITGTQPMGHDKYNRPTYYAKTRSVRSEAVHNDIELILKWVE